MNYARAIERIKSAAVLSITPKAENVTGGIVAVISLILSVSTLFGNLQGCYLAVFGCLVSSVGCLSLAIIVRKQFDLLALTMVTILAALLITIPQFFGLGGQPACFR